MLKKRKHRLDEDIEVDMVPIMNMFLVLIPFLLMSASFFNIKAINASYPVISNSNENVSKENQIKVTAIIELMNNQIQVSAISDSLGEEELSIFNKTILSNDFNDSFDNFVVILKTIKKQYPESDTLILIPDDNIKYETIIKAMDIARNSDNLTIFPNVVLSGKI